MKIILIILLTFFSFLICKSQIREKNSKDHKEKKTSLKVLKIITIGNEDYYYEGILDLTFLFNIPNEKTSLRNSDTLVKLFDLHELNKYLSIKLRVRTKVNEYIIKEFLNELASSSDTVLYVLNYDTLGYKEIETEKEKIKSENEEIFTAVYTQLVGDAEESVSQYRKNIEGKSYNKIADYLYDEGFSRSYSTGGSVLKEIFSITYTYGDIPQSDKSYQINISLWHSYGYGKLFYSIDYSIYLLGKRY